jgi:hypothetical protein
MRREIRSSVNIRNRLKLNDLKEHIKLYQKSWLDHLERTDRSRLHKLASQYHPRGRRDAGRPRKRWKYPEHLDIEKQDLKPKRHLFSRRRSQQVITIYHVIMKYQRFYTVNFWNHVYCVNSKTLTARLIH